MGVNDQQGLEELLEAFWAKGLVLFGERVEQEYALQTPIFIDLRHKLYDDLDLLALRVLGLAQRALGDVGRVVVPSGFGRTVGRKVLGGSK